MILDDANGGTVALSGKQSGRPAPIGPGTAEEPDVSWGGARLRPLRRSTTALLIGGEALLIAAIGLASVSSNGSPAAQAPARGTGAWIDFAWGLAVPVGLIEFALIVYAVWPQRRRKRKGEEEWEWVYEPPPVHWAVKLLLVALPLALLASAIAALVVFAPGIGGQIEAGTVPGRAGAPEPLPVTPPGAAVASTSGEWFAAGLLAAAALLVLAVVALWLSGRRRTAASGAEDLPARGVSAALDEGLDALRRERDPRRAVIAAYRAMERSLARKGLGREEPEAPLEYVARVIGGLRLSAEPVRRLATLFELARFSHHAVDDAMRLTALDDLSRLREELGSMK